MTLPRLKALRDYWKIHPPVHILLAGFTGYKASTPEKGSWIERKLSFQECLEEAMKPQEMKGDITAFASEIKEMGMGFSFNAHEDKGQ